MLRVFISGPYSIDPVRCTGDAIEIANKIRDAGHAVFVPHLSHFWHQQCPRPYDDWMEHDFEWLELCDVMVRIEGKSPGADREQGYAFGNGIQCVIWRGSLTLDWLREMSANKDRGEQIRRYVENALASKPADIVKDRDEKYGHPLDNFSHAAEIISGILRTEVTPEQVGLIMMGVKMARESHQHNRDNLDDIAGYAQCVQMVHDERRRRDIAAGVEIM